MFDVNKLLDNAANVCGYTTDNQLAKRLNVRHSAVSNWRNGRAQPDVVSAALLAEITGEKLQRVVAAIEEGRAKSAKAKAIWRAIGTAAAVCLAIYASIHPQICDARLTTGDVEILHKPDSLYIAHVKTMLACGLLVLKVTIGSIYGNAHRRPVGL